MPRGKKFINESMRILNHEIGVCYIILQCLCNPKLLVPNTSCPVGLSTVFFHTWKPLFSGLEITRSPVGCVRTLLPLTFPHTPNTCHKQ